MRESTKQKSLRRKKVFRRKSCFLSAVNHIEIPATLATQQNLIAIATVFRIKFLFSFVPLDTFGHKCEDHCFVRHGVSVYGNWEDDAHAQDEPTNSFHQINANEHTTNCHPFLHYIVAIDLPSYVSFTCTFRILHDSFVCRECASAIVSDAVAATIFANICTTLFVSAVPVRTP